MNWLTGRRLPRWTGVAVPIVAFPAVHAVLPWALSLLGARHGWAGGRPGISNLVGLIPVAAGFYIFFLCSREHFIAAPEGWLLEPTPHHPTPSYLLTEGPYRYSCNPIYLAELVIWLGWMAFYGSIVICQCLCSDGPVAGACHRAPRRAGSGGQVRRTVSRVPAHHTTMGGEGKTLE
jgi:protein-S-isoprenylcysteine O-methyltransferase Ste14